MNEVDHYILKQSGEEKDLLLFFHDLLVNKYHLRPKLSYGIPFYHRNKWVLYLNPDKHGGIQLSFTQGFKFENYRAGLEKKGRKMILSKHYLTLEEIDGEELELWLEEAFRIDNTFQK